MRQKVSEPVRNGNRQILLNGLCNVPASTGSNGSSGKRRASKTQASARPEMSDLHVTAVSLANSATNSALTSIRNARELVSLQSDDTHPSSLQTSPPLTPSELSHTRALLAESGHTTGPNGKRKRSSKEVKEPNIAPRPLHHDSNRSKKAKFSLKEFTMFEFSEESSEDSDYIPPASSPQSIASPPTGLADEEYFLNDELGEVDAAELKALLGLDQTLEVNNEGVPEPGNGSSSQSAPVFDTAPADVVNVMSTMEFGIFHFGEDSSEDSDYEPPPTSPPSVTSSPAAVDDYEETATSPFTRINGSLAAHHQTLASFSVQNQELGDEFRSTPPDEVSSLLPPNICENDVPLSLREFRLFEFDEESSEDADYLPPVATPPSSPTSPIASEVDDSAPAVQADSQPRYTRTNNDTFTRHRWTAQETEDLLSGCKKHGVGNWKAILADPSFDFDERNVVDLKDRFRVCFPGDYHRFYPNAKARNNGIASCVDLTATIPKAKRKTRTLFTAAEDDCIAKGFARFGPQWKRILECHEYHFHDTRRPRDLRDRCRTMNPTAFASRPQGRSGRRAH